MDPQNPAERSKSFAPIAIAPEETYKETQPLTECEYRLPVASFYTSPSGVDIINFVFEKWYQHNNRFTNDKYKIVYNHSKTYRDFSKRLKEFKLCADTLNNLENSFTELLD